MTASTSPSRVTNSEIQSSIAEISNRLGRIEERIINVEKVVTEDTNRVRSLQNDAAAQTPLVNRRLDVIEKRVDKHGEEIDELSKLVKEIAHTQKLYNWLIGLIGAGVIGWIVTEILALI